MNITAEEVVVLLRDLQALYQGKDDNLPPAQGYLIRKSYRDAARWLNVLAEQIRLKNTTEALQFMKTYSPPWTDEERPQGDCQASREQKGSYGHKGGLNECRPRSH